MNINELLNITTVCACGKQHRCHIKNVTIEKGALSLLGALVKEYHHILFVADQNTVPLCEKQVSKQLNNKAVSWLIYQPQGFLVPNEQAIAQLNQQITEQTELIVGIGSGVINDLCKYVSFQKNLPYMIIATAPSMDGYASTGAAMIINNMKISYSAHAPMAILADIDLLKNAPYKMIQSGYGDIIGKFSALNDWKLSAVVQNEYFCQAVYDFVYSMVCKIETVGKRLSQRKEEDIKMLMEALVGVGVAMSYVGNSRPASGSEHHLSHFFEVIGLLQNKPYFLHGIDVAYSCVVTQILREQILKIDKPQAMSAFDKSKWKEYIKAIYSDAAPGIIKLQEDLGWYQDNRFFVYLENWDNIRAILKETPSSEKTKKMLTNAGIAYEEFEGLYKQENINNAIWFAKDLKDRYSVLWLYYDLFYHYK